MPLLLEKSFEYPLPSTQLLVTFYCGLQSIVSSANLENLIILLKSGSVREHGHFRGFGGL
jgi:hypothetical protein